MAGDSATKPGDQAENESTSRQPFLIGVAGGTASGKVGRACIERGLVLFLGISLVFLVYEYL